MKELYILSGVECAVKLDGAFIGTASENYKIVTADSGFLEFTPLDPTFSEVCFLLGDPPVSRGGVRVYDIFGGYLLIPDFPRRLVTDYREVGSGFLETSYGKCLVKVVSENGIKLSFSLGGYEIRENVPFKVEEVKFAALRGRTEYAVVFLIGERTAVLGFSVSSGKPVCVFKNVCDGYGYENGDLVLTERKNDVLKHVITSVWRFRESVECVKFSVVSERKKYTLPQKLVPLAFFEELSIGGAVEDFLSPELKDRAGDLPEFFGKYTAALPAPRFLSDDFVMLLYKDKVAFAEVETNAGSVSGLKLLDENDVKKLIDDRL